MTKLLSYLAMETGLDEGDVRKIILRAPISYKFYQIDKRTTGKRLISQPAREVKAIQRAFVQYLAHLPIHQSATAYRKGYSIKNNAERHAGKGPIKKYDFKDFFHSIRISDWQLYCRQNDVFDQWSDVVLSGHLLFHRTPGSTVLRLAMGAPSSPWLSNVIMFNFDNLLHDALLKHKITYSRYADDLTFSAPRTGYLNSIDGILKEILGKLSYPKLVLNDSKTLVATMKYRRVVTGLVLANDGRVTIGRDRKRILRAALHYAVQGKNTPAENQMIAGFLAFARDVEPFYIERLKEVYGEDLLERLAHSAEGQPV